MTTMNPFEGMRDVKVGGGGSYLPANFKGVVRVKRCFMNQGFQNDLAFIAELEVVTSNLPTIEVGATRSWYQGHWNDRKLRETALGATKEFVAAVCGIDPRDEKAMKEKIDPAIEQLMLAVTG